MEHDTPCGWLSRAAQRDARAPALVTRNGVVSYADLDHQVRIRAAGMARDVSIGEIVPIAVHLDLASVVEIFALMKAGAVVAPYASVRPDITARAPEGTALCISTSGSGGTPRVVPLSYANLAASVAGSRQRLGNGPEDRWLGTLPLHHIGGMSILLRSVEAGGSVVLSPFGTDTVSVMDMTEPTIVSLVPTMVHRLLEQATDSLTSVGIVLTGGARLAPGLQQMAISHGVSIVPTYGMTEASSQIATAIPGSPPPAGGVVGPLLEGFSVSIRTGEGEAGPGEPGLIEIDGPAVFSGYLGEPPRTGAHRTGDLGFIDGEGNLGVIGRVDDVVITGGENVSLSRVTGALEAVTGVRDVAVVGIADREWGTAICAMLDLEPGSLVAGVAEELSAHLARHEIPKRMEVGSIPLLANGKHDFVAIRDRFAPG
jgi:O-succinylbenzoic acid--CoA ligase